MNPCRLLRPAPCFHDSRGQLRGGRGRQAPPLVQIQDENHAVWTAYQSHICIPPSQAKRQAPAVYPPPIEGRAPTAVNAVFTGLDAQQWAVFMDLLREGIGAVTCTPDAMQR